MIGPHRAAVCRPHRRRIEAIRPTEAGGAADDDEHTQPICRARRCGDSLRRLLRSARPRSSGRPRRTRGRRLRRQSTGAGPAACCFPWSSCLSLASQSAWAFSTLTSSAPGCDSLEDDQRSPPAHAALGLMRGEARRLDPDPDVGTAMFQGSSLTSSSAGNRTLRTAPCASAPTHKKFDYQACKMSVPARRKDWRSL